MSTDHTGPTSQPTPGFAEQLRQPQEKPETAVSEGNSAVGGAGAGADAVPDTPDGVPEDNIGDAESGDYTRTGRDAETDRSRSSTTQTGSDVSPDPTAADISNASNSETFGDKARRLKDAITGRDG